MKQSHQSFNACACALCVWHVCTACVVCLCMCMCTSCRCACMHACLYVCCMCTCWYAHICFSQSACAHMCHTCEKARHADMQLTKCVPKTTNLLKGSWTKPLHCAEHTTVDQQKLQKNTHTKAQTKAPTTQLNYAWGNWSLRTQTWLHVGHHSTMLSSCVLQKGNESM